MASAPGAAIIVRITADQPGKISVKARVSSQVRYRVESDGPVSVEGADVEPVRSGTGYVTTIMTRKGKSYGIAARI